MVRQHRFAQVYGYAVCLVCVIVGLISGRSLVDSVFDRARPGFADWGRELPATFEEFRAEYRGQLAPEGVRAPAPNRAPDDATGATLGDEELRRIYEARRTEARERATFRATKSLVGNLLLFGASVLLFLGHWRWLRGVRDDVGVPV